MNDLVSETSKLWMHWSNTRPNQVPWPSLPSLQSVDPLSALFEPPEPDDLRSWRIQDPQESSRPSVGPAITDILPHWGLVSSPIRSTCRGASDNWQRMEKVFDLAMEPKTVRTRSRKTPTQMANMRRLRRVNGACQTQRQSKKAVCMGIIHRDP